VKIGSGNPSGLGLRISASVYLIVTSAGIRTRDVSASSKTKDLFKILRGAYGEQLKDVQSFLRGFGVWTLSIVAHEPDAFNLNMLK